MDEQAQPVRQSRGGGSAEPRVPLHAARFGRLPSGLRVFAYFFYRYVLRLGFLDGQAGTAFHFLQGFWYRYLVDAKVAEVKRRMAETGEGPVAAIRGVLGVDVASGGR